MRGSRGPAAYRRRRLPLVFAWLSLLLAIGIGAAYLLVLAPQPPSDRVTSVRLMLPAIDMEDAAGLVSGEPATAPSPEPRVPDLDLSPRADTEPNVPAAPPVGTAEDVSLPASLGVEDSTTPPDVPEAPVEQALAPPPPPAEIAPPVEVDLEAPPVTAAPAWQRHARAVQTPEGLPRIAVVLRGLGVSSAASAAAIERLPEEVTLSFSPYARRTAEWTGRAREKGHEVLIDLPMEPKGFPARDPGPQALMADLRGTKNLERLDWILSKGERIVGVAGMMGTRFLNRSDAVEPVFRELKARGLLYLDNGEWPGNTALTLARRSELPHLVSDRILDDGQVSRATIESRLAEVERIAEQQGLAVALAHPYPVTIDLLAEWSRELDARGFALVPITNALKQRYPTRAASLP